MKKITVGIPAFKAQEHICDALSSIQTQTMRDEISVIIAKDFPSDDYSFVLDKFDNLDITILDCEKNTGPGLARQRALEACKTPWITFMDADDVFFSPMALECLFDGTNDPTIIEVQGAFFQELEKRPNQPRLMQRNDVGHPWVFGRLYNIEFLRRNNIGFTKLRAMEDGEFNWKIRMTIGGTNLKINIVQDAIYLWRIGSEHSITRIKVDEKTDIPQYNYDLCQWGSIEGAIGAVKFCKERNPFNGEIMRFATEMMIGTYFTYVETLERMPIFAEQNLFNAKKFYHECFKEFEGIVHEKAFRDIYTMVRAGKGNDLLGIIPKISFYEFMDKIRSEEYKGKEEFKEIRLKLPQNILDNDLKTGVFGE